MPSCLSMVAPSETMFSSVVPAGGGTKPRLCSSMARSMATFTRGKTSAGKRKYLYREQQKTIYFKTARDSPR